MSNSALANYVNRITPNFFYRSSYVNCITIKSLGLACDIYEVAEMIASGSTAYHYAIAGSGTIGLFVDEMYGVSAYGDSHIDDTAVQIVCTDYYAPIDTWNEGDIDSALANLVEDICRRNYILKLEEGINIFQEGNHQVDIGEINQRLTAARVSSESEALKAQSSIAVGAIKPFMAIIEPEAETNFDCIALRNMGCVGLMMFAGQLYDKDHHYTKPYKSKTLKAQMEKVIKARSHWALRTVTRARSLQEAKEEIYWFFFVVAKYPPKLGVWLETDLTVDGELASEIVELYYKYFVRWGLIDKSGLYCTAQQARLIQWSNFADRMTLWLNEPLGGVECLDELLTPSLFKFEYE